MSGRWFWFFAAMVGYVYAGYPALLTVLARLRPAQSFAPPDELPTVTLLIAAYNEQNVIASNWKTAWRSITRTTNFRSWWLPTGPTTPRPRLSPASPIAASS